MRDVICLLIVLFVAVSAGDFVLAVSQNIGAGVWPARGLGTATSAVVGGLGHLLILRGRRRFARGSR
ncbi:MAG: hypothetical protein E7Z97_12030 [Propionibacteriaceae bacterium]|jgi:hypothetical protein|nr:hypothetical protein [Propionibacteriaceae bacterium]